MKTNKLLIVGLLVMTSCSSMFHVIDDYCVSNEYDNNQLFCNPGCANLFIEYVKSIRWDTKKIVVEQLMPDGKHNWYFILSKDVTLKCNCYDTLLGPLSEHEKDSVLEARQIDISKMEEKKWRSPF